MWQSMIVDTVRSCPGTCPVVSGECPKWCPECPEKMSKMSDHTFTLQVSAQPEPLLTRVTALSSDKNNSDRLCDRWDRPPPRHTVQHRPHSYLIVILYTMRRVCGRPGSAGIRRRIGGACDPIHGHHDAERWLCPTPQRPGLTRGDHQPRLVPRGQRKDHQRATTDAV